MLDKTCIKTQIENLNFAFQWYTFKPFYQEWFDQSNSRSVYFFSFSLAGKYWMLLLFWNLGCPIWYPLLFRVNYIPLKGKGNLHEWTNRTNKFLLPILFHALHKLCWWMQWNTAQKRSSLQFYNQENMHLLNWTCICNIEHNVCYEY